MTKEEENDREAGENFEALQRLLEKETRRVQKRVTLEDRWNKVQLQVGEEDQELEKFRASLHEKVAPRQELMEYDRQEISFVEKYKDHMKKILGDENRGFVKYMRDWEQNNQHGKENWLLDYIKVWNYLYLALTKQRQRLNSSVTELRADIKEMEAEIRRAARNFRPTKVKEARRRQNAARTRCQSETEQLESVNADIAELNRGDRDAEDRARRSSDPTRLDMKAQLDSKNYGAAAYEIRKQLSEGLLRIAKSVGESSEVEVYHRDEQGRRDIKGYPRDDGQIRDYAPYAVVHYQKTSRVAQNVEPVVYDLTKHPEFTKDGACAKWIRDNSKLDCEDIMIGCLFGTRARHQKLANEVAKQNLSDDEMVGRMVKQLHDPKGVDEETQEAMMAYRKFVNRYKLVKNWQSMVDVTKELSREDGRKLLYQLFDQKDDAELTAEQMDELFDEIDQNDDGRISPDEIKHGLAIFMENLKMAHENQSEVSDSSGVSTPRDRTRLGTMALKNAVTSMRDQRNRPNTPRAGHSYYPSTQPRDRRGSAPEDREYDSYPYHHSG